MNLLIHEEPTVFVVSNDPLVNHPLQEWLQSHRARMEMHGSAQAFFGTCAPEYPGCLVWDTSAPGTNQRELFGQLARRAIRLPIIFVCPTAETSAVVRAMKSGAWNYLKKPLVLESLWDAIRNALDWDAENRVRLHHVAKIRRRLARLTSGEQDVLQRLLQGDTNRQIADAIGVSVRAIETRRAKVMHKMKAQNIPELVRWMITVNDEP